MHAHRGHLENGMLPRGGGDSQVPPLRHARGRVIRDHSRHVRDMAVQAGRSKEPVVRLEPFFRKATVAPPEALVRMVRGPGFRTQAARGRAAATVDSNRTDTRFDTPDSSCVTP